ncbi:sigma-54-dependent transcriptional regulator [Adhaeretor mobilis]|uniref:DNA-binding transcriptional regulator NtrC n=1 Tax=Adhaeretor mobilis TaxID=1930276 RepID=A0A517MYI5_9BACT|nr:sigma-54 dependent transcriptional regulator [Adhaeretor mobilis]QDS99913.1 Transcriptional regulatory protein ZraR [Adhaeretor mobilis]
MSRILVVDDEQSICWGFVKLGENMGHQVTTAASAEEGLRLAAQLPPDLLILDVRLPGMDGLTALDKFRALIGSAPVIVITAFGALDVAVEAVRGGAFEYLIKPFDLADVRAAIERALRSVDDIAVAPSHDASDNALHGEMVGATPVMQSLFKRIALAAQSEANILVTGESGVGKELAALAVHRYSPRTEFPFVAVNVAALNSNLAESELFGHVDGAFTGTKGTRVGLLQQADGGTLFLDEVADIPIQLQVKLLRAIEQQEVLPVGADEPVKTSFRVISATHQNLNSQVKAGAFRHDLFYRISAFEIEIPALRQRVEDIPLLASYFAAQVGGGSLSMAEDTLADLKQRPWHGNVRELRNAIEHASVVARTGIILPEHLPLEQASWNPEEATPTRSASLTDASNQRANELLDDPTASGMVYETLLKEAEAPLLSRAMERFGNECAPAARALGLHRTTLKKKLKQHNIESD